MHLLALFLPFSTKYALFSGLTFHLLFVFAIVHRSRKATKKKQGRLGFIHQSECRERGVDYDVYTCMFYV